MPVLPHSFEGIENLETGKTLHMGRVVRSSTGRTVIIAVDHGNYTGPVRGLEDPVQVIRLAIEGGADAVIANPGTIRKASRDIAGKIGVIARIDGAHTVFNPDKRQHTVITSTVESAAAMGVDAVVAMGYVGTEQETESLSGLGVVASSCQMHGLGLVAEMLPSNNLPKPAHSDEYVRLASRLGSELGADLIKTLYTGNPDSFREVVKGCLSPVVVAGGPKMESEADALRVAEEAVKTGGAGVAFGRNVWQSRDPLGMIRALVAVVHGQKPALEAARTLR
jgi:fructose-bisphosphate aldolase/2-amino-3,7-dideoxy-D-threo-hept-6-ulosonate synthase